MKSSLLSLLLLLLPQELLGFVPATTAPMHKKTTTTKPTASFEHPTISHHHHHHHFITNRQTSSVGLTVLSAASESVSIIEQLTNPLLIQHIATGGYVGKFLLLVVIMIWTNYLLCGWIDVRVIAWYTVHFVDWIFCWFFVFLNMYFIYSSFNLNHVVAFLSTVFLHWRETSLHNHCCLKMKRNHSHQLTGIKFGRQPSLHSVLYILVG